MAYQALYRKFRPQDFDNVKGQEHIVRTLRNQLQQDRIGHAYLFTGTRGTGKTTVAKILAKAVNCENLNEGSPCGHCASCQAIDQGNSYNVIEFDAASNNGVSNIRDIIEQLSYPPTQGSYKVYIIDEVHMLSTGAFNALLKTLEEPPSYAIFILATTEVNKIPITILSRCQRYDFHRISIDTIANRLHHLMEEEQIHVEDRAIRYIAKAADGSMRDALSILDQCIAFYLGEELTYDKTLQVLGVTDTEVYSQLLRFILKRNVAGVITKLGEILNQGGEPGQFVNDFTWYLRNLLLLQSGEDMEDALEVSSENLALLKEEASLLPAEVLMRYIRVLSELSGQLRLSTQKRILIEIALIKLCKPQMEEDYGSLLDRLIALEDRMATGVALAVGISDTGDPNGKALGARVSGQDLAGADPFGMNGAASGTLHGGSGGRAALPEALPEEVKEVAAQWEQILSGMNARVLVQFLRMALVSVSETGALLLVYEAQKHQEYLAYEAMVKPEQQQRLVDEIARLTGKQVRIEIKLNSGRRPKGQSFHSILDDLQNQDGIEFSVEDF